MTIVNFLNSQGVIFYETRNLVDHKCRLWQRLQFLTKILIFWFVTRSQKSTFEFLNRNLGQKSKLLSPRVHIQKWMVFNIVNLFLQGDDCFYVVWYTCKYTYGICTESHIYIDRTQKNILQGVKWVPFAGHHTVVVNQVCVCESMRKKPSHLSN